MDYNLPQFKVPGRVKNHFNSSPKPKKRKTIQSIALVVVFSIIFGFLSGSISSIYFYFQIKSSLDQLGINLSSSTDEQETGEEYIPQTSQEQAVIIAVEAVSPAVVSIVISKDVPILEEYFYDPFKEFEEFFGPGSGPQIPQYRQKGFEKQEVGGGTGIIVSEDGMILTNKHVVLDEDAEYTVFTNDARKFSAQVLARDPLQDLAILKIEQEKNLDDNGQLIVDHFSVAKLGDSDHLKMGQTVIAIGNALGEYRNTISVGVISGLGRTITASGGGLVETLEDVIQTDAAINRGNSGGPLVNLKGEVIGLNTAMALEAQSIGFSIPINSAKRDIEQVKTLGRIVYPFLGVRYILVDEKVQKEKNLPIDYGALIVKGDEQGSAIWPGSAAEEAGLREGDIILEFDGEKINRDNSLAKIIMKYNPGDSVTLRYLRQGEERTVQVILGERDE